MGAHLGQEAVAALNGLEIGGTGDNLIFKFLLLVLGEQPTE